MLTSVYPNKTCKLFPEADLALTCVSLKRTRKKKKKKKKKRSYSPAEQQVQNIHSINISLILG